MSLGLMLVTGASLISIVHGAFGRQGWMLASVALFVVLGGGTVLVQRAFKRALAMASSEQVARAHGLLTMCAIVVLIGWLMEAKPF